MALGPAVLIVRAARERSAPLGNTTISSCSFAVAFVTKSVHGTNLSVLVWTRMVHETLSLQRGSAEAPVKDYSGVGGGTLNVRGRIFIAIINNHVSPAKELVRGYLAKSSSCFSFPRAQNRPSAASRKKRVDFLQEGNNSALPPRFVIVNLQFLLAPPAGCEMARGGAPSGAARARALTHRLEKRWNNWRLVTSRLCRRKVAGYRNLYFSLSMFLPAFQTAQRNKTT